MFKKPFVVLDTETSGVDPKKDDIIEIAMIRYEDGKEVARYDDLIKVDYKLPEIIPVITGITDEELEKNGKDRDIVMTEVEKVIKGAYLVAHNSDFDYGFLKAAGIDLDLLGVIDTIPLAQILFPDEPSYSLESLSDSFNLKHTDKHRAMSDVEATLDLFKKMYKNIQELPRDSISEIQKHLERAEWDSGDLFMSVRGSSPEAELKKVRDELRHETKEEGMRKPLEIQEIFGDDGVLPKLWEDFEPRVQQVTMAQNVLSAFQEEYPLICEAPTGVGKSLAYLTAAAHTAISNKSKVIISTNTVNLQEQLFEKDIPLLKKIYKEATGNDNIRAAVLKGRSHYLCLRRLAEFKRKQHFTKDEIILLTKVLVWQEKTQTGDSAEIHLSRNEILTWKFELCSDKKYCSPAKCSPFGECYIHRAREIAEASDIIIVNHALLCQDLKTGGGLLPEYHYLVVDEAHHFEEVATKAYGLEISEENINLPVKIIVNHLEDLKRRFGGTLFGNSDAIQAIDPILDGVQDLQQVVDNSFSVIALFVNRNVQESSYVENLLVDRIILGNDEWLNLSTTAEELVNRVNQWLIQLRELAKKLMLTDGQDFPEQEEFTDELMQEIDLLTEQLGHLKTFFDDEVGEKIRWLSSAQDGTVRIHLAPLLMGPILQEELYEEKKSIVLTSATMAIQLKSQGMEDEAPHPFTYIRRMLGLEEMWEELVLDSPYNFETQAYIILPEDILALNNPKSGAQINQFFENLIKLNKGNILGLFTSYRAIENLYLSLMRPLQNEGTTLLAQRISGGRNKILKAYLNDPDRSVLFGTASFWEGVDIKGDALSTLVMHKLPFDMPNDPILKARRELFGNPFMEYNVPRAVLKFRQGFGRLIRSTKDFGCMIILDDRVWKKQYGELFMNALPECVVDRLPLDEIPGKVEQWLGLSKNQ